jgi:hypothetical protein
MLTRKVAPTIWLAAGYCLAFAYYLSYAQAYPLDFGDEGYLYTIASAIAQGSRPYRDIELYSYMPGLFYFLSLFAASPSELFMASRSVMAALLAVNACLMYWVASAGGKRTPVLAALAVTAVLCLTPGIWHKAYQTTLWLLLLGCAQRYHATRRTGWIAALGAVSALGLYFRFEVAAAGAAMIILLLSLDRFAHGAPGPKLIRAAGITLLAFACALLPLLALLAADGILGDYLNQLLDIPRRIATRVAAPYRLEAPGLGELGRPWNGGADAWLYWGSFLGPGLLLVHTALLARRSRQMGAWHDDLGPALILLLWLALNLPQYAWERPDPPHLAERLFALLASVPLIIGAYSRRATGRPASAPAGSPASMSARAPALLLAAYFSIYAGVHMLRHDAGAYSVAPLRATLANGLTIGLAQPVQPMLDHLIEHTRPGEAIAVLPFLPGFHFATSRPFLARRVYLFPFNSGEMAEAEYICALERQGTRYVIYDEGATLDGNPQSRLANYAPRVHGHLMAHFGTEMQVGGWALLRRTRHASAQDLPSRCRVDDASAPGPRR